LKLETNASSCFKKERGFESHQQEVGKMEDVGDPADELIALFGKITTSDHDSLVTQFSRILNTDLEIAKFFLEASSWSVEKAVHAYLAETTNGRDSLKRLNSIPVVNFISDLSDLQSTTFSPGQAIDMNWTFRNEGLEPWPSDTKVVFVDGQQMNGFYAADIPALLPGQIVTIPQRLRAPGSPGTYTGTWRFYCSAGYFGDPLWMIVTVGELNGQSDFMNGADGFADLQIRHEDDDDMMEL